MRRIFELPEFGNFLAGPLKIFRDSAGTESVLPLLTGDELVSEDDGLDNLEFTGVSGERLMSPAP